MIQIRRGLRDYKNERIKSIKRKNDSSKIGELRRQEELFNEAGACHFDIYFFPQS